MDDLPNFLVWRYEELVSFAKQAYTRLQRQEDAVMAMQRELKDCQQKLATLQQLDDDWK